MSVKELHRQVEIMDCLGFVSIRIFSMRNADEKIKLASVQFQELKENEQHNLSRENSGDS